jgi:hypothetical protein
LKAAQPAVIKLPLPHDVYRSVICGVCLVGPAAENGHSVAACS